MNTSSSGRLMISLFLVALGASSTAALNACVPRMYTADSIVCVCNSTYCDQLPDLSSVSQTAGTYASFSSSQSGNRFLQATGAFVDDYAPVSLADFTYTIKGGSHGNAQQTFGFGGTWADSTVSNILSLSTATQDNLLSSYYASNGSEYTMNRVPMAANDGSTHWYSYDDYDGDFALTNFSLTPEDIDGKIPLIQRAQVFAGKKILLFGTPWGAPWWMKTTGMMNGSSALLGPAGSTYSKTWAKYFVKFVQAYESYPHIKMWGLAIQNEPGITIYVPTKNANVNYTAATERDFIKEDLGPALTAADLRRLKLMIMEDQRFFLPDFPDVVLAEPGAAKYVDGISVHFYFDLVSPPTLLAETHRRHPTKFLMMSEGCNGLQVYPGPVDLGNWTRGEGYATDIMENLNNWVTGWTDWNMVLNPSGGPNQLGTYIDAQIIANSTADEFYKQPMYYAMAHFSKFIPTGSTVIQGTLSYLKNWIFIIQAQPWWYNRDIQVTTAQRPDGGLTLVTLNKSGTNFTLKVIDERLNRGNFTETIPARSIRTFVWY